MHKDWYRVFCHRYVCGMDQALEMPHTERSRQVLHFYKINIQAAYASFYVLRTKFIKLKYSMINGRYMHTSV